MQNLILNNFITQIIQIGGQFAEYPVADKEHFPVVEQHTAPFKVYLLYAIKVNRNRFMYAKQVMIRAYLFYSAYIARNLPHFAIVEIHIGTKAVGYAINYKSFILLKV